MLVGKMYPFRAVFACVVDMKGADEFAVHRLAEFLRATGVHHFAFKCDQESSVNTLVDQATKEAAIKELVSQAAQRAERQGDFVPSDVPVTVPENSAVGSSASNGRAERAVQMVEDLLRTHKGALEDNLQLKIPCSHPVIRWLVEHVADIINKFSDNATGKWPYEELHGKCPAEKRCKFGERVYHSTPKRGRAKMNMRWRMGTYLGHSSTSNEVFVGLKNRNVIKVRSIVRVAEPDRWRHQLKVHRIAGAPERMRQPRSMEEAPYYSKSHREVRHHRRLPPLHPAGPSQLHFQSSS